MMPAWKMKLTPLALLRRSSDTESPSMMLGVLATSSGVKYHWSGRATGSFWGLDGGRAVDGDATFLIESGRGGDVRVECEGGDGTAGGTSRLLAGDLDK